MAFDDLGKVAPLWMNLSLAIFLDKEANKEWGWVQVGYSSVCICQPFSASDETLGYLALVCHQRHTA